MKKILTILTILLALLVLSSCTNDVSDPIKEEIGSWEDVFRQYWETMSLEYVHFSEESGLDWDGVYDEYLPKFRELDFDKESDSLTAFSYFKKIACQLTDYHYALLITDKFGNCMQMSPATLQKWKEKNPGRDIDEYPDVYIPIVEGKSYKVTSIKRGFSDVIVNDTSNKSDPGIKEIRKYREAVEGAYEVRDLALDSTSGEIDIVNSDFHGGQIGFDTFVGYTIDGGEADSLTTDKEKAWYTVVNALGLEDFSYCFGLTSDGYFYFYLSAFPSTNCLNPLLYEKNLTSEERASLKATGMDVVHDILWCQNQKKGVSYDLSAEMEQLEGITAMLTELQLIGASDKCTFDGLTWLDVKGVIMDVRSNGGGAADFLFALMGSFFTEETLVGKVRYRDGYSRYDYTPWIDYYLEKSYLNQVAIKAGRRNYENPFVVIANGSSVSCSEIACIIAKLLPNSKIVGGQTYGGTCALVDRTLYQSGPFKTDHLYIYTTTFQAVDSTGTDLEGKGITPDVAVDIKKGEDARYKKAVETIKNM